MQKSGTARNGCAFAQHWNKVLFKPRRALENVSLKTLWENEPVPQPERSALRGRSRPEAQDRNKLEPHLPLAATRLIPAKTNPPDKQDSCVTHLAPGVYR